MAHQTLKRSFEDLTPNNDNLNDEYDVTWGGKKCRYLYNYTLQSDIFSNTNDSDETESVHSIQSKSTIVIKSEVDSVSSCGSDCDCQNSSQLNYDEYEVRSSSSSRDIDSATSDSSTTLDYMVTQKDNIIYDANVINSDNGYLPDDTDVQATIPKTNLPPPACFKTCLQCGKENPNPYFQFCYTCYRSRVEYFEDKPIPKKKKKKKENYHSKSYSETKASSSREPQESSSLNSFETHRIGIPSKHLFQKQNDDSNEKSIDNHTSKIPENNENICNICFILPKNGVFNHGKIGHIYCCYKCAKKCWKKSNKCPVCNSKVKFVTKMIVV